MKYWTINILNFKYGYSFAVKSKEHLTEDEILESCAEHGYFDEIHDIEMASVKEITGNEHEMKHWEKDAYLID